MSEIPETLSGSGLESQGWGVTYKWTSRTETRNMTAVVPSPPRHLRGDRFFVRIYSERID